MLDAAQVVGAAFGSLVVLLILESVAYRRGGYLSEFWRLGVDDKLDHIALRGREWRAMSLIWVPILGLLVAATAGLTRLLANAGEGVLASAGLAVVVLVSAAWLVGVSIQGAGALRAASDRAAGGETPAWLAPLWSTAEWTEGAFILGVNAGYLALGTAAVRSEFPAAWTGWAALVVATAIIVGVVRRRDGFPQLALLAPLVFGVGLLVGR